MKEWLESSKKDFNRVFNADKVFGILIQQGKLKISQEQINEILKIVRDDNQYKLNKMNVIEGKEFSKQIKDEDFIESQCKKLAIVRYFESLPS
jgi:F420-dependent methylenetetrahydromethanopterin dehydrogenase